MLQLLFPRSKIYLLTTLISFGLLSLNCTLLNASGWGKTEEVYTFEGITWNKVFFDLNELHLEASLPNYSGATLSNGLAALRGTADDAGYVISTTYNGGYTPPKKLKEFVKLIQDANPDCLVTPIDAKKFGAMYVVELTPKDDEIDFWRMIATKDRIIQMGTDDENVKRRSKFFDSLTIN